MECNREEAERAREMAEERFLLKDYISAKKFAEKAQQLYPSLENIEQIIAVIDVHVASLKRIGPSSSSSLLAEKDWYQILQIEPDANDESVKKQYRKLALFLHPDKNKAVGAESAFKLIGEALQVLSDKTKRVKYDAKRNKSHNRVNGNLSSSSSSSSTTFCSSTKVVMNNQVSSPPIQAAVHLFTFWTVCTSCQMRYQYYRKYENQNLLCPQCRKPFIAKDLSDVLKVNVTHAFPPHVPPLVGGIVGELSSNLGFPYITSNFGTTSGLTFFNSSFANSSLYASHPSMTMNHHDHLSMNLGQRSTNLDHHSVNLGHRLGNLDHILGDPGLQSMNLSHDSANLTYRSVDGNDNSSLGGGSKGEPEKELFQKMNELRKAREIQKDTIKKAKVAERTQEALFTAHAWTKLKKKVAKKRKNDDNFSSESEEEECENGKPSSNKYKKNAIYNGSKSDEDMHEFNLSKKLKVEIDSMNVKLSFKDVDMTKRLIDLAKSTIRMQLKLQASKATTAVAVAATSNSTITTDNADVTNTNTTIVLPPLPKKPREKVMGIIVEKQIRPLGRVLPSFMVPDADFHNFDEGREEKDVEVGQIWALYDEKDGFPRYYVKVKEVRSRTPFKVLVGWFELRKRSENISELLDMGFSFTCGEFRISSSQVMDSVNSFSHIVKWEKGSCKGMVKIYPKKGEVWVIYEDWEEGQQIVKVTHGSLLKYHMVEVLNDSDDEMGLNVVKLQKVKGFRTIFGFAHEKVFHVPFVEMNRFSHRVPAYKMRGDEAPGLPKGCVELDPAAVPFSLLDPDSTNGAKSGTGMAAF